MTFSINTLMSMTKKDLVSLIENMQRESDHVSDLYYTTKERLKDIEKDYSEAINLVEELTDIKLLLARYKTEHQRASMGCSYAREAMSELLEKLVDYAD